MIKGQPIDSHMAMTYEPAINKFFRAAIKMEASDLHLKVGQPPKMRIHSILKNTNSEVMTEELMEKFVFEIMTPAQKSFFLENAPWILPGRLPIQTVSELMCFVSVE